MAVFEGPGVFAGSHRGAFWRLRMTGVMTGKAGPVALLTPGRDARSAKVELATPWPGQNR